MMRILQQAAARGQVLSQVMGLQQQAALTTASMTTLGHVNFFGTSSEQHDNASKPFPGVPIGAMLCQRRSPSLLALHGSHMNPAVLGSAIRSAGHAAGPPIEPNRDVWGELRASGTHEYRHSLGGAYYSMIVVFGFAVVIHDIYAFPGRTVAIMSLMAIMMYTRR